MTRIACLGHRNQPHALALIGATYRQAGAAMRLLMSFLVAHPRVVKAGVRIGAVGLLFYAASFYTRDWRPVVAQADQPAAVQATTRSKAEPRSGPGKLVELPAPIEPATYGFADESRAAHGCLVSGGDGHPRAGFGSASLAGAPGSSALACATQADQTDPSCRSTRSSGGAIAGESASFGHGNTDPVSAG